MGNSFVIDDHDNLRVQRNKIPLRNLHLPAIRQAEAEWAKAIAQSVADLLEHIYRFAGIVTESILRAAASNNGPA